MSMISQQLALHNQVNIDSALSVEASDVVRHVEILQDNFFAENELVQLGQVRQRSLGTFLKDFGIHGHVPPSWLVGLGENTDIDFEHDVVTDIELDAFALKKLLSNESSRARLEVTTEIFHLSGKLLNLGTELCANRHPNTGRLSVLPAKIVSRLLLGANNLIRGTHPMSMHFLQNDCSIGDLKRLLTVGDVPEWPIYLGDGSGKTPVDAKPVHGAPDFDEYLKMWHDLYH